MIDFLLIASVASFIVVGTVIVTIVMMIYLFVEENESDD